MGEDTDRVITTDSGSSSSSSSSSSAMANLRASSANRSASRASASASGLSGMVSRLEILGDLDLIELGVDGPDEHKLGDDEAIDEA